MTRRRAVLGIVVLQAVCIALLVAEVARRLLGAGAEPDGRALSGLEAVLALGLVAGLAVGVHVLRHEAPRDIPPEAGRRTTAAEFHQMLDQRFAHWSLTPAERDVALFALKGLTTAEIARLRQTSEGTVKAQTNTIYRKAGVSGRAQLLSLFIDDLLEEAET